MSEEHFSFEDIHQSMRKQIEDPMRAIRETLEKALPDISGLTSPLIDRTTFALPEIAGPEERHSYESSREWINAVVETIRQWKHSLPTGCSPAVLAVLATGVQIQVTHLANVSFHGVQIEGFIGKAPCVLLAHQASVQVLCYAEEITPEKPRRKIGFCIDGSLSEE